MDQNARAAEDKTRWEQISGDMTGRWWGVDILGDNFSFGRKPMVGSLVLHDTVLCTVFPVLNGIERELTIKLLGGTVVWLPPSVI